MRAGCRLSGLSVDCYLATHLSDAGPRRPGWPSLEWENRKAKKKVLFSGGTKNVLRQTSTVRGELLGYRRKWLPERNLPAAPHHYKVEVETLTTMCAAYCELIQSV